MRLIVAFVALTLCTAGCTSTPQHADAKWRVIPLNVSPNSPTPDRCAILLNEQTGETWIYNSADQWVPIKRY